MDDYKKIYEEMLNFFKVDNMQQVCLKLGLNKDTYKSWTQYKKIPNRVIRKFNKLKSDEMQAKIYPNMPPIPKINQGVVQVGGVGNMIHNTSSVPPVEDYKKTYEEMLNFFGVSSMGEVCIKLGFSEGAWSNWTRAKKVSDKALRRFNKLKSDEMQAKIYPNMPPIPKINQGVVQVGGVGNMIHNTSSVPPVDVDMQELIYLIQTYATPKMKLEIREKLLAIKNLDEKMDSKTK